MRSFLFSVQVLQRLPSDSLQRIPRIGLILKRLFIEMCVSVIVSACVILLAVCQLRCNFQEFETILGFAIDATFDDYEQIGNDFVPFLGRGVAVDAARVLEPANCTNAGGQMKHTSRFLNKLIRTLLLNSQDQEQHRQSVSSNKSSRRKSNLGGSWLSFLAEVSSEIHLPVTPLTTATQQPSEESATTTPTIFRHNSVVSAAAALRTSLHSLETSVRTAKDAERLCKSKEQEPEQHVPLAFLRPQCSKCTLCAQKIPDKPSWTRSKANGLLPASLLSVSSDALLPELSSSTSKLQIFHCGHTVHQSCHLLNVAAAGRRPESAPRVSTCSVCGILTPLE